jgi:REP element-mobilizing transposase RayT
MAKYQHYVAPYASTYAYCLLPNHFHFLIKTNTPSAGAKCPLPNQLRKLFLCYAHRINYNKKRTGGLFTKSYQRIEIQDEAYLLNLVNYIHKNPVRHGVNQDFKTYLYSSYRSLVSEAPTYLDQNDVFSWFGGKKQFIQYHQNDLVDPSNYNLVNIENEFNSENH